MDGCLTADRVRELLDYDPQTGVFTWKVRTAIRTKIGAVAGWNEKYTRIGVDGGIYAAHRIAWLYVYGEWPSLEIDHIDGDPLNNAIENLRLASHIENARNRKKNANNTTGFKGVYRSDNGKRFVARIRIVGKLKKLGTFDTAKEAHDAYMAAANVYFGEFARWE